MSYHFSYKADKIILIFVFGVSIYLPLLFGLIKTDLLISNVEKRSLAKLPSLPNSIQAITNYPKALNQYYSDHFGLREQLTSAYFSLIYKTGAINSVSGVTFGLDGWMFLGDIKPHSQSYDDPMGNAIHENIFSEHQLKSFAQSIMAIKTWLNNRNIKYIYVIVPDKHSIYFDKLPTYITKQNKISATDQLVSYLQKHTNVNVVDLRPSLLEAKKHKQIYFKTDSHWNFHGANTAQFEIMKKIELLFPGEITPTFLKNDQFKKDYKNDGDLAILAKTGVITEESAQPIFSHSQWCDLKQDPQPTNKPKIKSFTCQSEGLKAIVFGDSFFGYLKPYVGRYFHKSLYLPPMINYNTVLKVLALKKPDIVIEEVVERNFPYLPTTDFLQNLP